MTQKRKKVSALTRTMKNIGSGKQKPAENIRTVEVISTLPVPVIPAEIPTVSRLKGRVGRKKGTPKTGGRKAGMPNRSTLIIRTIAQELFQGKTFQKNLSRQFMNLTLDPSIMRALLAYAYGRPPEKIEISGPDGGPIKAAVTFYLPKNQREKD